LDQNFISDMAKADQNDKVNPQFKAIYELLHEGFVEEKTFVPTSWIHKVESSLIPKLKERLSSYRAYLGQVDVHHPGHIAAYQLNRAARIFNGEEIPDISADDVYSQNPDQRTERFKIDVNMDLSRIFSDQDRKQMAKKLDEVRKTIASEKRTVKEQLSSELKARLSSLSKYEDYSLRHLFRGDDAQRSSFLTVDNIITIPQFFIDAFMWAKILVDHPNRPIGDGDASDIEMISTYLPYVDVLATDTFMAEIIKQLKLDQKYGTVVFGANKAGLTAMEKYIADYLASTAPVNRPSVSVFVLPDEGIRNDSFDFFKKIGLQAMSEEGRHKNWVKLFSFDDGKMPQYMDPRIKLPIPFHGLQDVEIIKITEGLSREQILDLCRANCRSVRFILIDKYSDISDDFIHRTVIAANSEGKIIDEYQLY